MAAGYKEQAIELLKTMIEGSDDLPRTIESWASACVQCSKIEDWKEWIKSIEPEDLLKNLENVENFL